MLKRDDFEREHCTGLCECGCGQQTTISDVNFRSRGWVKGQPRRFIVGHYRPAHVEGNYEKQQGRRIHAIRAEKALGKPLPLGAVVHHADGSKASDAPLVICQDHGYHSHLHARMRVLAVGGNPNTQKVCSGCKQVKNKTEFGKDRSKYCGLQGSCRECLLAKHLTAPGKWSDARRRRHSVVMRGVHERQTVSVGQRV